MTAPTARLLGAISFALATALTLPSLVAGIGVYAALLNLLFAGLLALTGRLLWPVLTATVTAVNVFVTSVFPVAADKGIAAWASVVLPFVVVAACMVVGRRRAEHA